MIIFFAATQGLFSQSKAGYDTITLAAVGDIMLGTSYPDRSYLPPGNDPFPLVSSLFDVLSEPDLTFGNLEGAFSDSARLVKTCRDTTNCYAFRVPEISLKY